MLGHKTSLSKFKKTEIISSIFSHHSGIKLEINYKRKTEKHKKTRRLNDMLGQMDLIDIFRSFHPKTAQCTYYSSAHRTFSKIDHMFGHKTSLSKFKKTEIISSNFSDYNA